MAGEGGKFKRREVLQLLREWRAFHTAFGGAFAPEDSHLRTADYHSAGYIAEGAYYDRKDVAALADSYRLLNDALALLKREDREVYLVLVKPYLGDPADPSVVEDWKRKRETLKRKTAGMNRVPIPSAVLSLALHDRAVRKLAEHLEGKELFVLWPERMSESEEKGMEKTNAEMYALFQRIRASGIPEKEAIRQTAIPYGVGNDTVERVIEFRRGMKVACLEEDCDRPAFSQGLCRKHYQRRWRQKGKPEV